MEAFKHLGMTRDIGGDGYAEEEYDFNVEVKLEQEVGCVLGKLLLALFSVTGVRLAEQVSPEKATVFQSCPHGKCCVSIYLSITLCVCVCVGI